MKQMTKLELAILEFKTQSIRQNECADLTDEWNSVCQHIHDLGYNPEHFEDLSNYMLKATNIEAANYYEDYFFPRFELFHQWVESDNVCLGYHREKVEWTNNYLTQCTQYRKEMDLNTLFNYYLKEYYNV